MGSLLSKSGLALAAEQAQEKKLKAEAIKAEEVRLDLHKYGLDEVETAPDWFTQMYEGKIMTKEQKDAAKLMGDDLAWKTFKTHAASEYALENLAAMVQWSLVEDEWEKFNLRDGSEEEYKTALTKLRAIAFRGAGVNLSSDGKKTLETMAGAKPPWTKDGRLVSPEDLNRIKGEFLRLVKDTMNRYDPEDAVDTLGRFELIKRKMKTRTLGTARDAIGYDELLRDDDVGVDTAYGVGYYGYPTGSDRWYSGYDTHMRPGARIAGNVDVGLQMMSVLAVVVGLVLFVVVCCLVAAICFALGVTVARKEERNAPFKLDEDEVERRMLV